MQPQPPIDLSAFPFVERSEVWYLAPDEAPAVESIEDLRPFDADNIWVRGEHPGPPGPTARLRRKDGTSGHFLDVEFLGQDQWTHLCEAAVRAGLLRPAQVFAPAPPQPGRRPLGWSRRQFFQYRSDVLAFFPERQVDAISAYLPTVDWECALEERDPEFMEWYDSEPGALHDLYMVTIGYLLDKQSTLDGLWWTAHEPDRGHIWKSRIQRWTVVL